MVVVFFVVAIFFGMPAIAKASQINENVIVVGVGIDLCEHAEKKYDVSFLTFTPVPEQNFIETYKVVVAEGNSIAEAANFAGLNMGRLLRFSHMKTIVLCEDIFDDDVPKLLDYLARGNELSGSTKVIATPAKAKEFLTIVQALDGESSIKISELVTNNASETHAVEATLETFYKGYLGPTKVSLIPIFDLKGNDDGMSVESGQNQQGEQKFDKKKFIVNTGEAELFKDGKRIDKISSERLRSINWVCGKFERGFLEIENFDSERFGGASVTFEIFGNSLRKKVEFENGVPVVYLNPRIDITLAEIEKDGMYAQNTEFEVLTDEDIENLNRQVRAFFADGISLMRTKQADIADFYTLLHNANKKEFEKFLRSLDNQDEYLNYIVFKVGVKTRTR